MDSTKKIFWNKAMFWGFILAVALMVLTSVYYATDNMFSSSKTWVETAIYIIGIVLCAIAFKKSLPQTENFPYSKALGLGVATSFFSSIILALFTFILYKYIDPELIDQILLQAEEKLIESGLDYDMIEMQIEMQRKFVNPSILAASTIFSTTLTGLIISLITSIFLKRNSSNGFDAAMSEIKE